MKREKKSEAGPRVAVGFNDQEWQDRWPILSDHLGADVWEDGGERTPSTLSVSTDGGLVKVALNDVESRRSAYATSATFRDAMDSLESALSDERVSWRSWGSQKKGGRG